MTRWILCACLLATSLPIAIAADDEPVQLFAEPKKDWVWDEDKRFDFLMERLASLEASLDAVNTSIAKATGKKSAKQGEARRADANNTLMDRKGGGPMPWKEFYGTNAEKFFYHPVDPSTTYRTDTLLRQMGSSQDDKVGSGVPASQSLPVHQRPPQWDYIYRANRDSAARAEEEAAKLEGKLEALNDRRLQLEHEQAELWARLAFRVIERLNIPRKPVLRFALKGSSTEPADIQRAMALQAAARFLSTALLVIEKAEKEQAVALTSVRDVVSAARDSFDDSLLEADAVAEDVANKETALGKYVALAQLLDDTANNLGESYDAAVEGDQANDEARKDRFRGLLQRSLLEYSQIVLALDELITSMKSEWRVAIDTKSKLPAVSVAWVSDSGEQRDSGSPKTPARGNATKKPVRGSSAKPVVLGFNDEERITSAWLLGGEWRLQNGGIRFLDGGSLGSLFRVKGDSVIQVEYLGGTYHRVRVRAWGQSFIAEGPFVVVRQGNEVTFSSKGKPPESIQLKADEVAQMADTSLEMRFESNSHTPSHVVMAVAVRGEIVGPE
jgi:hypothetical protein